MFTRVVLALLLASLALTLSAGPVNAQSFSSIVVYGDSLSDNGNMYAAIGYPWSPYWQGRRSNGPVAVEYLSTLLKAPLIDLAWIGATTGIGNYGDWGTPTSYGLLSLPGMQTELIHTMAYLGPYLADGLFVVWGGPNDFFAPSPEDATSAQVIARAVGNLTAIVNALRTLGAKHILVPGMPDLGLTPNYSSQGPVAAAQASADTDAFNAALTASLPPGVIYFDTASVLRSVVANPAAYGLTNVTDTCYDGDTVCATPEEYLFWDDVHPTTVAAYHIAAVFRAAVSPGPVNSSFEDGTETVETLVGVGGGASAAADWLALNSVPGTTTTERCGASCPSGAQPPAPVDGLHTLHVTAGGSFSGIAQTFPQAKFSGAAVWLKVVRGTAYVLGVGPNGITAVVPATGAGWVILPMDGSMNNGLGILAGEGGAEFYVDAVTFSRDVLNPSFEGGVAAPQAFTGTGPGPSAATAWNAYNVLPGTTTTERCGTVCPSGSAAPAPVAGSNTLHVTATGGFSGVLQSFPAGNFAEARVWVKVVSGAIYVLATGSGAPAYTTATGTGWITLPLNWGSFNGITILAGETGGEFYVDGLTLTR